MIVGLVVGTGVTVVAALSPARKAGKVAPIAAMQDAATTSSGYGSKQRIVVGTGVLAAGAVALFVGLVSFITIFASSFQAAINTVVNRSFTGDFVIDSGAGMGGGFDPSLARRVNQLPQVALATGVRVGMAKIEGSVQQVVGVDPKTAFGIFDVQPLQGNQDNLGRDAIAVYKTQATDHHLKIGSYIPVQFATGTRLLRVALIYGSNEPAGNYFLGISAYQANFTNQYDYQVFVKKAPGVSSAAALAAVKTVTSHYPGATVLNEAQYKAQTAQPINQILGLIYVLLALAVVIALLGIGNTLALSIFERIQEIGLLRAVGMTRRQLRSTIHLESVVIALQGTVLGLLIGVSFGWAITHALNLLSTSAVSIPYRTMVAIVILAALGGILAAVRPARRAAKLNILRAIVSE